MKRKRVLFVRKNYPVFEDEHAHDDDDVLSDTQAAMAFVESSLVAVEKDDGEFEYVSGSRESEFISSLHQLARRVVMSKDEVAKVVSVGSKRREMFKLKPTEMIADLIEAFGDMQMLVRHEYPAHRYSPVLKLFLDLQPAASQITQFFRRSYDNGSDLILPNKLIRRAMRKLRYMVRIALTHHKTFARNPRKNFSNMIEAMEDAAECSPRLASGRIDLFIGSKEHRFKTRHEPPSRAELKEFMGYRRRFIRYVQNRLKGSLLRMFTKLEYGRDRFFHVHCLILLNGQHYKDMPGLMDELGAKWDAITGCTKSFTNVHKLKRRLHYEAIGLVDVRDRRVQIGLQKLASYFTLADVFVKLEIDEADVETFAILGPVLKPKPGAYRPVLRMTFREAVETITYM